MPGACASDWWEKFRGRTKSSQVNLSGHLAAVTYGAIGVFRLGVVLDVWLLVGAIVLTVLMLAEHQKLGAAGLRAGHHGGSVMNISSFR